MNAAPSSVVTTIQANPLVTAADQLLVALRNPILGNVCATEEIVRIHDHIVRGLMALKEERPLRNRENFEAHLTDLQHQLQYHFDAYAGIEEWKQSHGLEGTQAWNGILYVHPYGNNAENATSLVTKHQAIDRGLPFYQIQERDHHDGSTHCWHNLSKGSITGTEAPGAGHIVNDADMPKVTAAREAFDSAYKQFAAAWAQAKQTAQCTVR